VTNVRERSELLRAALTKHQQVQRGHDAAKAIRGRVSELAELREAIAAAVAKVMALRAKDFTVEKPEVPAKAADALAAYLSQGVAVEGGKEFGRLKRALEKVRDEVHAIVVKALEDLRRSVPTVDDALLKQIEQVPGCAAQVATIRQERTNLLRKKDLNALSAEELANFLDQCQAVRTLADALDVAGFPKEVLEFFKAVRKGGAPLDKFTNVVRNWLEQRDQLRHVRVTVVNP
jgi:hypothetical protein